MGALIVRILQILVGPRAVALFSALIPILLALQTFIGLSAAVAVQP